MRPLFAAAVIAVPLFVACPSPDPEPDPDGGAPSGTCTPACNPDTQLCNAVTGLCDWNEGYVASEGLKTARAAQTGPVDVPVNNAIVTYVVSGMEDVGANGFFLQARKEGPALFVAVDPAVLEPMPAPGDKVKLRVTEMRTVGQEVEARAIANYELVSSGNDVGALVQDVSGSGDLLTNVNAYDGEILQFEGKLRHDWLPLGTQQWSQIELRSGFSEVDFMLRTTSVVTEPFGTATECSFTAGPVPLRRFGDTAQIWAYRFEDFLDVDCPDTLTLGALALNPTSVRLRFDRPIDPASVKPDGSQFTLGNGLTAQLATVKGEGREVWLTTTVQTPRAQHTVAIASDVKDVLGGNVVVKGTKGDFLGYFERAKLLINEVDCNVTGDRDLIELIAVTDGSTADLQLTYEGNPVSGTIGTFPDTQVVTGDLIVVHLNATPAAGDAVYNEILAKDEQPTATNFPDAWDFVYDKFSCAYSNVVLRVRTPDGATMDGVAFVRSDLMNAQRPADYGSKWLKTLQLDGHWMPKTCGGLTCSYASIPSALDVSVDWKGTGVIGGKLSSISRSSRDDSNKKEDWVLTPTSSFGALNPGQ